MQLIDFLHRQFQTLPIPVQIMRFSDEFVEFCDLAGRPQISLSREDWSVEYVSDNLNKEIVEEIVKEILLDYRSIERIRVLSKSIYK